MPKRRIKTREALQITNAGARRDFVSMVPMLHHYSDIGFSLPQIQRKWYWLMGRGYIANGCDCGCLSSCSGLTHKALKRMGYR